MCLSQGMLLIKKCPNVNAPSCWPPKLMIKLWYHKSLVRVNDRLTCIKSPPHMVMGKRHAPLKKVSTAVQVYVDERTFS